MAQPLLPVRFKFLKFPVTWEVSTTVRERPVFCGRSQVNAMTADLVKLIELDAWECREELFTIPGNDVMGFTRLLTKLGVWSTETGSLDWSRYPLFVHLDDVLHFRDDLRNALLFPKEFMAQAAPKVETRTLLDLMAQSRLTADFRLRFETGTDAAGVVTITNGRTMLLATVIADLMSGTRFKTCQRRDCRKPFSIKSRHKRRFCCTYCGHLDSLRKIRAKQKQRKRPKKVI